MIEDTALDPSVVDLAVGLVQLSGVTIGPADAALSEACRQRVRQVVAEGPEGGDDRRQAVRRLLRAGGFKPSGRNKPAQEYLLRTASQEAQWPAILNAVDVLNVISLESGLPISMVALDRAGAAMLIRCGRSGESFVFNASGQVLEVAGLICICGGEAGREVPLGSPVKDSQAAKVTAADQRVLACLYAPRSAVARDRLQYWSQQLADGLKRWCAPQDVQVRVVPDQW